MARRALIFGGGGHARVIASLLQNKYREIQVILPKTEARFFREIDEHRKNGDIFIGIGDNKIRAAIYEKLAAAGVKPGRCVSDHAFVARDAQIDEGAVICPGAVIMARSHVGPNTIVNTLSSVDHDCRVGKHTQITAGVILGGNTVIGEGCFFGIRSATVPDVVVKRGTIVMAGSLVTKNFPPNVVLGGYPAGIVKRKI